MAVRSFVLFVLLVFVFSSCDQFNRELSVEKWDSEQQFYGTNNLDELVKVRLSHESMTVAEILLLEIEIFSRESRDVQLPTLKDFLSSEFEVRVTNTDPPFLEESNLIRWSRSFELLPFLPGVYKIPAISILLDADRGIIIKTDEIFVDVISVIPETDMSPQLRENTKLYRVPMRIELIILLVFGSLILVFLVFILIRRGKRWINYRRAKKNFRWPYEIAIADLKDLKAEHSINNMETSVFYTKVSDVMRQYLRQRFFIHAPERTTEEVLSKLQSSNTLTQNEGLSLTEFLLNPLNPIPLLRLSQL